MVHQSFLIENDLELTEVKVLMVEHLEFCSPLIRDEIDRWHDLLWEDYLYYQQGESSVKELSISPRGYHF